MRRRKKDHFCLLRVGKHPNPHLQNAFWLYGESAFEFQIIEITKDLLNRENVWIKEGDYNVALHAGSPMLGRNHGEEAKKKISETHKGIPKSEEQRRRMSESAKGKVKSKIHCMRISLGQMGRKCSDESRKKMSVSQLARCARGDGPPSNLGIKRSLETRRKMSLARLGKPFSESHRANICKAQKLRWEKYSVSHFT